jgi:hypothetical protein
MTAKQALDKTIRKFQKLVEEGKEPDWNFKTCPLCQKYFHPNRRTPPMLWCKGCFLYAPKDNYDWYECVEWAGELGINNNSPEILQILYQIRIYLYGWRGLWKER